MTEDTLAISKNTVEAAIVALRSALAMLYKDIETGRGYVERYPEEDVWLVCLQSDIAKAERMAVAMRELEVVYFGDPVVY